MDPSIATILGGITGGIIGAVLAGPVTYHYSKRLIQQSHKSTIEIIERQAFHDAATSFYSAFVDFIIFLDERYLIASPTKKTFDVISESFPMHLRAFIRFKSCLGESERCEFEKA